ncbi:alkaline phosphatase D family protein [Acidobacteriota bacterium]
MRVLIAIVVMGLVVSGCVSVESGYTKAETVHMANGIKIGEVDPTSAIVWARLTKHPERNLNGTPFPDRKNPLDAENRGEYVYDLERMEAAVPGVEGQVRISYGPTGSKEPTKVTAWHRVLPDKDFTRQMKIEGLLPGTKYSITAEGRGSLNGKVTCKVEGGFKTAALAGTPAEIRFTVVTGQDYPRRDDPVNGHQIYPHMFRLGLEFFVHTGDIEYYDKAGPYADNVELARFKWNRIYSMPFQRAFHNQTASYFIKDDHDTLRDDCWPGQSYGRDLTWEDGLAIFREQVPMGDKTYRTVRWGKDLQIWLVEGRDFRSPNNMADGPDKTIWGERQKKWFFDTVQKSDATFRILISPTPIVGPDRESKNDNHANKGFTHEGDQLRKFIGGQKNMFVVCGDRHWQYVSVDPTTGTREYSCGPTSDKHAGGFKEENRSSMHRYLRIKGGFLSVTVERVNEMPTIIFRHHGVDGSVYNEDIITQR